MDNAGAFTLGDFSPTTAGTIDGTPVTDLDGMRGFTVQAVFDVGDGSDDDAVASVYVKTSIDQGTRWADVAVMRFHSGGGVQVVSVEAASTLTPIVPTTNPDYSWGARRGRFEGVLWPRFLAAPETQ